jgi:hypothetical protein
MKTISISLADLPALLAQLPEGSITKPSDAVYDDGENVLTFADALEASVTAALTTMADGRKTILKAHAAAVRYHKETAGVTFDGNTFASDRGSQSKYVAAMVMAQIAPQTEFQWKTNTGFVLLNSDTLKAAASAVAAYVQDCFAREAEAVSRIEAGTMTTAEAVDAFFAAA